MKKLTIPYCDCCGKLFPQTLPDSRQTLCCLEDTKDKYPLSQGKRSKAKIRFPVRWVGFLRKY